MNYFILIIYLTFGMRTSLCSKILATTNSKASRSNLIQSSLPSIRILSARPLAKSYRILIPRTARMMQTTHAKHYRQLLKLQVQSQIFWNPHRRSQLLLSTLIPGSFGKFDNLNKALK